MIRPEDISDPEIKKWYEKHNKHNFLEMPRYVKSSAFQSIYPQSSDISMQFQAGYREWSKLGVVNKNNPYVSYLQSFHKYPALMTMYDVLDLQKLINLSTRRFIMADNIFKNGLDANHPLVLYKYRYPRKDQLFKVETIDKNIFHFNAMDGHHRLICSYMNGIDVVPVIQSKMSGRPIDIEHILSMAEKNKWTWYQPIDFGPGTERIAFQNPDNNLHGKRKFNFIIKRNLGDIRGKTILDLGCNTGVISACIAEQGAELVIGVDRVRKIQQTRFVSQMLWKNYGNLVFKGIDILNVGAFSLFVDKIDSIDWVTMINFAYYMGEEIEALMDFISHKCEYVLMQGNNLKRNGLGVPAVRIHSMKNYRGEYSSVSGMSNLLNRHGYFVTIDAPQGYAKPVVVGRKRE